MKDLDNHLVVRVRQRLDGDGPEALYLRNRIMVALIAAAELAGDKDEAHELAKQHLDLCRERDRAFSRLGGQ